MNELEKENVKLHERVSTSESENARLLERSSTSHASEFPTIPREQYEVWILDEARVEVVQVLVQKSFVYKTALKEARGYDPGTPQPDADGNNEEYLPKLKYNIWCDSSYSRGEDK